MTDPLVRNFCIIAHIDQGKSTLADHTETNNLVAAHPEKVEELLQLYDDWAHRCGVMSWPLLRR